MEAVYLSGLRVEDDIMQHMFYPETAFSSQVRWINFPLSHTRSAPAGLESLLLLSEGQDHL